LLIAVKPESEAEILEIAKKAGIELSEVGVLKPHQEGVLVEVE
jgi:selenide,water dikinase